MNGPGIAIALRQFAQDEGWATALNKAEKWRNMLEEMAEVANDHQLDAINELMLPLSVALDILLEEKGKSR